MRLPRRGGRNYREAEAPRTGFFPGGTGRRAGVPAPPPRRTAPPTSYRTPAPPAPPGGREGPRHPREGGGGGPARGEILPQERQQSLSDDVPHAVAEGPHPGKDDPPAGGKILRIAADQGREPEGLEGLAHAAQVPHSVVHDADGGSPGHKARPLTRELPSWRGHP